MPVGGRAGGHFVSGEVEGHAEAGAPDGVEDFAAVAGELVAVPADDAEDVREELAIAREGGGGDGLEAGAEDFQARAAGEAGGPAAGSVAGDVRSPEVHAQGG